MVIRALISISFMAFTIGFSAAQSERKWTSEDFRTRLIGHTNTSSGRTNDGGRYTWVGYYDPNGRGVARAWGPGLKIDGAGTWRISRGNLCSNWPGNPAWGGCYEAYESGRKIVLRAVSGVNRGRSFSIKILGKGNVRRLKGQ